MNTGHWVAELVLGEDWRASQAGVGRLIAGGVIAVKVIRLSTGNGCHTVMAVCTDNLGKANVKNLVILLALVCASCGYELGRVHIKEGSTDAQRQVDMDECRDVAINHGGADGAAWIPFAGYSVAKHIRREAWKECMQAKGYTALPPKN